MKQEDKRRNKQSEQPDRNPDPITGAPGAHPVGTGVGAVAGGAAGAAGAAAIGAAAGTVAGPVGTVVGGAVGAIVGGLAGKAVAEQVNPTEEEEYWRENYRNEPYHDPQYTYEEYAPGYRTGYQGYARYGGSGKRFEELEPDFRTEYERSRGTSKLSWEQARPAARAAWDRIDRRRIENYLDWEVVDRNENSIGTLECLWADTRGEAAFVGVKTGWFFGKTHVVPANSVQVNESRQRIRLPYDGEYVKNAPAYDSGAEMTYDKEQEVARYYGTPGSSLQTEVAEQPASTHKVQSEPHRPTPEQATIQLSEEQMRVSKREVEAGGVRLRKIVRKEVVNKPVELQREEIVIERVPAGEAHSGKQASFNEQEVYIPLRREEATVEKETVLKEEVRARKQQRTDKQEVSGEVRREDVEVENTGEARTTPRSGSSGPADEMRDREEQPRSFRRRE